MARGRLIILIVVLLGGPPLAALYFMRAHNAVQKADMNKFEWLASNSAPRGALMKITLRSSFYYRGGGSLYIPPRSLHPGWGTPDSSHVVGPDKKPIPDEMSIIFYSYLEDKFYEGTFPLPYDHILELFAKGYWSDHPAAKPGNTYDTITAGVAPGGVVAVWVEGLSRRKEVFFGHAKELAGDWHELCRMPPQANRAEVRETALNEATEMDPLVARYREKIPFGLWDLYRTKYTWNPVFEGMAAPKLVQQIDSYNGERDYLRFPLPADLVDEPRPVPKHIDFVAQREGVDHKTWFQYDFDEDEIFGAFRRLGAGGKSVSLVFGLENVDGKLRRYVSLRSSDGEARLARTTIRLNRTNR